MKGRGSKGRHASQMEWKCPTTCTSSLRPSHLPPIPLMVSYSSLPNTCVFLPSSPLKFGEPQFSLAQIPRTPDFTCHTGSQDPTARCRLLIEKKGNNPPDLRKLPRVADAEMGESQGIQKSPAFKEGSRVSSLPAPAQTENWGKVSPDKTGSEI